MESRIDELLGMDLVKASDSALVRPLIVGAKTDLIADRLHLQIPDHGIEIVADLNRTVSTIFLHSEGADGYHEFSGTTPERLSFEDSQATVRRRLGPPNDCGGGEVIPGFGKVPIWDRYDRGEYFLHVEYGDGESSIRLLSIMRPDSVPR